MIRFAWGRVIDVYEFGPYRIDVFHPHKTVGSTVTREIDESATHYHGYIDGKDCHESWLTLDDALAGMIVRRQIGPNHSAINYHFIAGVAALSLPKENVK